jgi:fatty-acid peroxygenase
MDVLRSDVTRPPKPHGVADSTLALLRNPYRFISERAKACGEDVFETRIMLRRTICMTGPEAATVFYDPARFQRAGAAPARLQKTLFGRGGVQGLDGQLHRTRKECFLAITSPARVDDLAATVSAHWATAARRWTDMDEVTLYPEMQRVLTTAACSWAGAPLADSEAETRTRQISALFDAAGAVGPRHWRARRARKEADLWAQGIIEGIRAGDSQIPPDAAAYVLATHRTADGQRLPARIAAVELLNVIRPTVAVSVYITFVAHALARSPGWRRRLAAGDGTEDAWFVQEVRRFYPFFPAVAAVVREDFVWRGQHFPRGRRTLLDLHGINHDPRAWRHPDQFDPDRFRTWEADPYTLVPQGGGDVREHHRCPGEPVSLRLMTIAVDFLTRRLDYVAAVPDEPIDDTRLPALPRDGFRLREVTLRRS